MPIVDIRPTVLEVLNNPVYELYKTPARTNSQTPVNFSFQKYFFGNYSYMLVPVNGKESSHSYMVASHVSVTSPVYSYAPPTTSSPKLVITLLVSSSCHTTPKEHQCIMYDRGGEVVPKSELLELLDVVRLSRIATAVFLSN